MSNTNDTKTAEDALVQTMIRLRPHIRAELTAIAKSRGMTLGAYLRWLVERQVSEAVAA